MSSSSNLSVPSKLEPNSPNIPTITNENMREYLYASHANVSNFVSVKLSGDHNYLLWKTQMLCLIEAHDMLYLLVDDDPNKNDIPILMKKYDSLLRGWIFGSVSEDVLLIVVGIDSAKDVWKTLGSYLDPSKRDQQERETKGKNLVLGETSTKDKDEILGESQASGKEATQIGKKEEADSEAKEKNSDKESQAGGKKASQIGKTVAAAKILYDNVFDWDSKELLKKLQEDKDAYKKKNKSDGNTILHIAVGLQRNDWVELILSKIGDNVDLIDLKNSKESTVLHIAAIVGNTYAAKLLLEKHKNLLDSKDIDKKTPLQKAFENMNLETTICLLDGDESKKKHNISDGVKALVQAYLTKQFGLASTVIDKNPEYAVSNDKLLMAMATTFPSGLDRWERFFYPWLHNLKELIVAYASMLFLLFLLIPTFVKDIILPNLSCQLKCMELCLDTIMLFFMLVMGVLLIFVGMITWVLCLTVLLILIAYSPFSVLYYLMWKVASKIVTTFKDIEQKKEHQEKAIDFLDKVCKILKDNKKHPGGFYRRPILEAACQDAYYVVDRILSICPDAILCENENGYDIFQLATIHRSEKTFNMIYSLVEHQRPYKTFKDSSKNNMLHLAGRLAPINKLKRRAGAALQLQSELQWQKAVKNLLFPTSITKDNIFKETPEMVFTKEHKELLIEGEQWMKTVAESSSITAALITTIVFAAAITVPGGCNEGGVPVFLKNPVFTIFAFSDAISLFFSVVSLLLFLAILTQRYAEKDFLFRLPRRLIFALSALFISTDAMMLAFGATVHLVFFHKKQWTLFPIFGLTIMSIVIFSILQLPLIIDLIGSTYISRLGKINYIRNSKFNPNSIQHVFDK